MNEVSPAVVLYRQGVLVGVLLGVCRALRVME